MSYRDVDAEGFIKKKILPDGRKLTIAPISATQFILGIGLFPPLEEVGVYFDMWIYLPGNKIFEVFETWNPVTDPEPPGWWRHPSTGRRRTDGDPEQEYIQW